MMLIQSLLIHYVGVEQWSRAYCPVQPYQLLTTNIAESLNSCIRHACKLPICSLLEFLHNLLQRWFCDKHDLAESRVHRLTESAATHVEHSSNLSQYMQVRPVDNLIYKIKDEMSQYTGSLMDRTCTCRHFQMDLLPCSHAVAAIR